MTPASDYIIVHYKMPIAVEIVTMNTPVCLT